MIPRSRIQVLAVVLTILAALAAPSAGGAAPRGPANRAAEPLPSRCGAPDREIRELLYGFPFDPSDCSATQTNPTEEYDPDTFCEIPVVVHVLRADDCIEGDVSDELVHSQIEILNEDFMALPGTNGEDGTNARIRFALAREDPEGNPTPGITRHCNTGWFNDNGAYWEELAWDPHNYLNIYTNKADGALGYVPFFPADGGGNQVGQPHDRVVIRWEAFGRDAPIGPPFDQGRTATHEVGHYLGLEHTFWTDLLCGAADPPDCYEDGDLICDTEVQKSATSGCPQGAESCDSRDPIHNYMNYSDDLCMQRLTLEQVRRNRCTLRFYRPDLYDVVDSGQPDLAIDKTATVEPDGTTVRFSLEIENLDLFPAAEVEVTDALSDCVVFQEDDCGGALNGDWTWTIGDLAAGGTRSCELVVDASGCAGDGERTNTATVSGARQDPDPENDTAGASFEIAAPTEVFTPVALTADPEPLTTLSDGNGLFEPGERVVVAPAWRNDGEPSQLLTGTASGFTGPAGPTYTPVDADADYGDVAPGETAGCLDTGGCYEMEILPEGMARPAPHWDATFDEALSDETDETWTLHVGDSFADVPRTSLFYLAIETLLHSGVSTTPALVHRDLRVVGCGEGRFCPTRPLTRAQAAVFLLKAASPDLTPPPCEQGQQRFADVPFDSPFCPWIEELARREVTAGCGDGDDYCPAAPISRSQMAVLLLRTLEGGGYMPPECAGELADVSCASPFADWIGDLLGRGITSGCGTDPLRYCPADAVSRQQMAAFVTRAFELVLYGP